MQFLNSIFRIHFYQLLFYLLASICAPLLMLLHGFDSPFGPSSVICNYLFLCNFCKIIFNDFNHFTHFIANFERFSYGTIQFKNIISMATDFYCENFTMIHAQLIFNCILFSLISIHYFEWDLSIFYLLLFMLGKQSNFILALFASLISASICCMSNIHKNLLKSNQEHF